MTAALWVALIGALLYALHRLGLWMEERGWIYYKKRGSSGALSSAFLEVQSILEPGKRYELEIQRKDDAEDQESGDPPTGGDSKHG